MAVWPGLLVDDTVPDIVNDQPDTDETPEADDAARGAALVRLAARSTKPDALFDADVLGRVDVDGWATSPRPTVDSQKGTLQREAEDLAADPADRAEIAELRADLGGPRADLPA